MSCRMFAEIRSDRRRAKAEAQADKQTRLRIPLCLTLLLWGFLRGAENEQYRGSAGRECCGYLPAPPRFSPLFRFVRASCHRFDYEPRSHWIDEMRRAVLLSVVILGCARPLLAETLLHSAENNVPVA